MDAAPSPSLRPATAADFPAIRSLLERSGLPTSDLSPARPEFVVADSGGSIVGVGALERFGDTALLRSVAVEPQWQDGGIGSRIVEELERRARAVGIAELVLLTLTARNFFLRHGYGDIDREHVPAPVLDSAEFRSLCPASAVCMHKRLAGI